MTTLYILSRWYFWLREALARTLASPFVQTGAFLLLAVAIADRLSMPANVGGDVQPASLYVSAVRETPPAKTPGVTDERLLAWAILAERGSRGAAERAALEHLFARGEPLDGLSFGGAPLDLSGLNLGARDGARAQLRGVHFGGVALIGARFDGADLTGAFFAEAALMGADFTAAALDGGDLSGADLTAATLRRASVERTPLDGASLSGADLRDVSAARATAVGAKFDGVLAMNSDWRGVDFTAARLAQADFTGAQLDHARFDHADVSSASFLGATGLDTASYTGAWAWADAEPTGLPDGIRITLCNPGPDGEMRRAYMMDSAEGRAGPLRPEGC